MNTKKSIFLLGTLLLLQLHSHAQQIVLGRITDPQGNGIAFASIGVGNTMRGVLTDSTGQFAWRIGPMKPEQRIRVSAIGYGLRSFTADEFAARFNGNDTLQLEPLPPAEPLTAGASGKVRTLGEPPRLPEKTYRLNTGLQSAEVGMVIKGPEKPYRINSLTIHLSEFKGSNVVVRVNLYKYTEGKVGARLHQQNLYLELMGTGPAKIDLNDYELVHSGEVLVTVEQIQKPSTNNIVLRVNDKKGDIWLKDGPQNRWVELFNPKNKTDIKRFAPCYELTISY